jgi:hypothetical protein
MKIGLLTLGILVVGVVAAFALSEVIKPEVFTWRYKITVEIETPEGIKSGSAVRELRVLKNNREITPQVPPYNFEVVGEAVVVDMGERGTLFGLIGSRADLLGTFDDKFQSHPPSFRSMTTSLDYEAELELGITRPFERDIWFVAFEDIEDPQSIFTIKPEDFESFFGKGVKLKNKYITIVDEPISYGRVEQFLNWINFKRIGIKRWDPTKPDQAKYLTKNNFIEKGNLR